MSLRPPIPRQCRPKRQRHPLRRCPRRYCHIASLHSRTRRWRQADRRPTPVAASWGAVLDSTLAASGARLADVIDLGRHDRAPRQTGKRVLRVALCAGALAGSCSQTSSTNRHDVAAAGLGVAVGGAVVYRALTGNCYAQCGPGYACDRKSGLCVRLECAPGCPMGQQCVRDFDGSARCLASAGTLMPRPSRPDPGSWNTPAASSADASVDTGAAGAPPTEDEAPPSPPTDGSAGEGATLEDDSLRQPDRDTPSPR